MFERILILNCSLNSPVINDEAMAGRGVMPHIYYAHKESHYVQKFNSKF